MPDANPRHFELREFVPFLTNRVGVLMEQTFTPTLKREGLTLDMWRVMMVLHFNGPHTLIELSRLTGVKTPTLSRLVGRMIEKRLLTRRRSQKDARTVQVRLRSEGETLFRKLWPEAANAEAVVTSPFDDQQLESLKAMLRDIETVLVKHIQAREETSAARAAKKPSGRPRRATEKSNAD